MQLLAIFTLLLTEQTLAILPPSSIVKLKEAPFFVDIRNHYNFCGGTIIMPDIIITAGHCLQKSMTNISSIIITAGSILANETRKNRKSHTQTRSVASAYLHRNYKTSELTVQRYNDIGLIRLSKPLTFNQHVTSLTLGIVDPKRKATIYGFGSSHPKDLNFSNKLLQRNVSIIDDYQCEKLLYRTRTKPLIQCYETCTDEGTCWGDVGGPLVQVQGNRQKLVGIMSWGTDDSRSCDKPPSIYVKVANFLDWIKDGIKKLWKRAKRVKKTSKGYQVNIQYKKRYKKGFE